MRYLTVVTIITTLFLLTTSAQTSNSNLKILDPHQSRSYVTPYTGSDAVACPETPTAVPYAITYATTPTLAAARKGAWTQSCPAPTPLVQNKRDGTEGPVSAVKSESMRSSDSAAPIVDLASLLRRLPPRSELRATLPDGSATLSLRSRNSDVIRSAPVTGPSVLDTLTGFTGTWSGSVHARDGPPSRLVTTNTSDAFTTYNNQSVTMSYNGTTFNVEDTMQLEALFSDCVVSALKASAFSSLAVASSLAMVTTEWHNNSHALTETSAQPTGTTSTLLPDCMSNSAPTALSSSARSLLSTFDGSSLIRHTTFTQFSQTGDPSPTSSEESQPQKSASVRYRGFNVVNQAPMDPHRFKTTAEWTQAFSQIRNLLPNINAVRLYSTTDGTTLHLANAIPAAKDQNLSIFAGVWSGGDLHTDRFEAEKSALDEVLLQHGCDDIIAVSIGNEDMYSNHRNDSGKTPLSDIMLLVNQTQQVMDVLDKYGCCDIPVTHTDTFGDWLATDISEPLIRQVDFLTVNIFPFWESQPVRTAGALFWQHVEETKQMAAKYDKAVWIGETGWPMRGNQMGEAIASAENMHIYWDQIGCDLMGNMSAFWYASWDADTFPSFGLMDQNGRSLIGELGCHGQSKQAAA